MTVVLLLVLAWLLLPLPVLVLVGRCMATGQPWSGTSERPLTTSPLRR